MLNLHKLRVSYRKFQLHIIMLLMRQLELEAWQLCQCFLTEAVIG